MSDYNDTDFDGDGFPDKDDLDLDGDGQQDLIDDIIDINEQDKNDFVQDTIASTDKDLIFNEDGSFVVKEDFLTKYGLIIGALVLAFKSRLI